MNISPETPPKGDFAAYIDQLMREAQDAAPREGMMQGSTVPQPGPDAAAPGSPPAAPAAATAATAAAATGAAEAAPATPAAPPAPEAPASAAAATPAAAASPTPAAPAAPAAAPGPPPPAPKTLLEAATGIGFLGHAKWLVLGWVVVQVLDALVPDVGLGLLFYLGVLGYVGWVMATINRGSGGALAKRMRELSAKATEEARKSGLLPEKNQP